jgi:hypothetical protein
MLILGGCVVVAIASLAIPAALGYDPWAWLVWGREVTHLDLHSAGGPSWKPLPVLATAPISLFGTSAPVVWLVLSRTAGLLAIVGVFRLGARLAGGWAGALAAGLLLLTPDAGPRFVRLVLEGHSAPITAALAVWAIDRHLAGKHGTALVLTTLLALDRPEAWPFLVLYAAWLWRTERSRRVLVGTMLGVVPLLWFGGDWWASGSPLHGADSARVSVNDQHRFVDSLRRVGEAVIPPAWFAAALAVAVGWRERDRTILALAAGVLAWFALVVAMSAGLGYAALSRFLLPGVAVLCVLAGVGVVRFVALWTRGWPRVLGVMLVVVAFAPLTWLRADNMEVQLAEIEHRAHMIDGLDDAFQQAGGVDAVRECGRVAVDEGGVPQLAAAWKLGIPLADVTARLDGQPGFLFVSAEGADRRRPGGRAEVLARTPYWNVYAAGCPAP